MIPWMVLIVLILILYVWSYFLNYTYIFLILSILTFILGGVIVLDILKDYVLYEYFTQKSIDIIEGIVVFGCFALPLVRYEGHWIFRTNSMRIIYQIEEYTAGITDYQSINRAVKKNLLEHIHLFKEYNAFFFTKKGIKKSSLLFMKSFKFKALINADMLIKDEQVCNLDTEIVNAYCDSLYQKISEL